jgi:hypothetical protein
MEWVVVVSLAVFVIGILLVIREASGHRPSKK